MDGWSMHSALTWPPKDPRFNLARLVLSNADPLEAIKNRQAVINDEKVFNINLKGVNKDGAYPGPVVNQASSGRCWLFATSKFAAGRAGRVQQTGIIRSSPEVWWLG